MSWVGFLLCNKQDPIIGGALGYVTDACRNLTIVFLLAAMVFPKKGGRIAKELKKQCVRRVSGAT
jgi:hypothetical protein